MREPGILRDLLARSQEWVPWITFPLRKKNVQEAQYIGYRGQRLHWMRIVDTGQQGTEMVAIGGHKDTYTADESPDKVYVSNRIRKYVLKMDQALGMGSCKR